MKTAKFIGVLLMLALLLALPARAGEAGMVWLSVSGETDVLVMTDTVVADGLITIAYDGTGLQYGGILAAEETVAQYAVNAREPGVIKISWVSGNYSATGDGKLLFRLSFTGSGTGNFTISGQIHDVEGNEIAIGKPDTAALEAALASAKGLDEARYTSESWAALTAALEQGRKILADPMASTQEMNRAARAIVNAVDNLRLKPPTPDTHLLEEGIARARELDPERYTPHSFDALRAALEQAVDLLSRDVLTQEDLDGALKRLEDALEALQLRQEETDDQPAAESPTTQPATESPTTQPPAEYPTTKPAAENPETPDREKHSPVPAAVLLAAGGLLLGAVCLLRGRRKGAAK